MVHISTKDKNWIEMRMLKWYEMRTWKTGVVAISDWEMVILTNPQFSHGMPQLHQGVKNARRFTGAIKLFWSCISNNKNMGYDIPGICNFFTVLCARVGVGNFMYFCIRSSGCKHFQLAPKQGAKPFTIHVESASVWTKWFQSLIWGNSLFRMHHPSRL